MEEGYFAFGLFIAALFAAIYIIAHAFESADGGPPTKELQERNEKRESWAMFWMILFGVIFLIIFLPALLGN